MANAIECDRASLSTQTPVWAPVWAPHRLWDAAAGCWRRLPARLGALTVTLHPPPVPLSHVLPGHGEG